MVVCDECNGWLNPALAADSAVRRGDEVLLIQRKFPPMKGAWAFPGGFVERDEDTSLASSMKCTSMNNSNLLQVTTQMMLAFGLLRSCSLERLNLLVTTLRYYRIGSINKFATKQFRKLPT